MRTVWKYPLSITDKQSIEMPAGAVVVHVGPDPAGTPCIWMEVDTKNPPVPVDVFIRGTGHEVLPHLYHAGSFVLSPFVWHVYI